MRKPASGKRRAHSDRRSPLGKSAASRPRVERGRTDAAETPLTVRAHGVVLSAGVHEYIEKRAGFRLSRFARPIERVSVRFDRVRSADGSAPSIRCRIKVVVSRLQSVVAEATARNVEVAFGEALDANARWVNHLQERRRRLTRRRKSVEH